MLIDNLTSVLEKKEEETKQEMKQKDFIIEMLKEENAGLKKELNAAKAAANNLEKVAAGVEEKLVDAEKSFELLAVSTRVKELRIADLEMEVNAKDAQIGVMKEDAEKVKDDLKVAKEGNEMLHSDLCAEATEHHELRNNITQAMFPMGFSPLPFPMGMPPFPLGFMPAPPMPPPPMAAGLGAPVLPVIDDSNDDLERMLFGESPDDADDDLDSRFDSFHGDEDVLSVITEAGEEGEEGEEGETEDMEGDDVNDMDDADDDDAEEARDRSRSRSPRRGI